MDSKPVKKDMEAFQTSVKQLSDVVSKQGSIWKDAKFAELTRAVSNVAKLSRDVILSGEQCCSALDYFTAIANERY